MKIPTFEEAEAAIDNGHGSPLDKFVAEHEPGDDVEFRHDLQNLVDYMLDPRKDLRERMAGLVLSGMVANPGTRPAREVSGDIVDDFLQKLVVQALDLTDALIAELNKEKP